MSSTAATAPRFTRSPRPRVQPAPELPLDVRLMNGVAGGIVVLAGCALLAAGAAWAARAPAFSFAAIALDGDLARNNVSTLRANALPRLRGNFFSMDLQQARAAFESVPWVRRAEVRRVWPNRLAVRLEEHQPAAIWRGEDGNDRLVNRQGEVFEANVGDVEDDGLPQFGGPEGSSAALLAAYASLAPVFARIGAGVAVLELSGRGSWRAEFDDGARIELGRGSVPELVSRSERFVRTLGPVKSRFAHAPLAGADLRHPDGYALRLRGVTTGAPLPPGARPAKTVP